jgi:cell division protein FtsA
MARREERDLWVALDVGTSKCRVLVGQAMPEGHLEVVSDGIAECRGVNRGDVVNIEATIASIRRAVENAEQLGGCRIVSVNVGTSGPHIQGHNSTGVAPVRGREVSQKDVESVTDAARAVLIPADQRIFHVIPQEFMVDGRDGIHDPVGMHGVRLEARVHLISGSEGARLNVQKCVERSDLIVDNLFVPHITSAESVLLPEERALGVGLIDIGAGTSDIAIYRGGAIRHSAVLAMGGNLVTNDISMAFRTPAPSAEQIKIEHGCAWPQLVTGNDAIEVRGVGDGPVRQLSRQTLAEVIWARYDEIFRYVQRELRRSETDEMIKSGGLVLTGGAAAMPGIVELAEQIFEIPVRVGYPQNIVAPESVTRDPSAAAVVGVLLAAYRVGVHRPRDTTHNATQWLRGMKDWFARNF